MYRPRARGIGILPYALPGVTGLVIGLSVFWFRLVMGFCYVDSDDSDDGYYEDAAVHAPGPSFLAAAGHVYSLRKSRGQQ